MTTPEVAYMALVLLMFLSFSSGLAWVSSR